MNLEREVKLSVGPLFRLPDLNDLADGVQAQGGGAQRFVTSYHDTADLRLARWGASLRYRTGEGWTVKLPKPSEAIGDDTMMVREEHTFDAGPGRPPAPALDLVRAFVRTEPVKLAVRLQTLRRRTELLDEDGRALAEVVDDEVSVLDGRRVVARFRELEIELANGGPDDVLRSAVGRLREHGAQPSDAIPKYVRALQPRASDAPDVGQRKVRRHASIAEVVGAALSASAARLIVSDPAVRLGEDPEGVHQARVATRRLRSDLRTFRSVLDADRVAHLRAELGWLGDELGSVRDLDVLGERLRHHLVALGEDDAVAARKILDRLRVQRDEARAGLLSAMREDRYSALLDQVVSAAADPAVLPDIADTEASSLIGDVMEGPWGHLETACAGLGDDPLDEELHAARIRAKRVRYAAESLLPVAHKRARAFARRAATLQDVLGHHQDAVFAIGWLREQGSGTTSRVAFAAGRLAGVETDVQREARRAWPKAWKALRSDKVRFW